MSIVTAYFRELYDSAITGWNRFWFRPSDPATLGLIRLLGGTMIFYTHLVWSIDLLGFFGPNGRISAGAAREFYGNSLFVWSYLHWIESPALLWFVHVLALIVLAMFAAGLFTRITSVLAFVITVSYIYRAPFALFGLDQINGLLALYLMLGPSGAVYSLDSLFARRGWSNSWPKWLRGADGAAPSVTANLAIRLIQLHMCVVYLFAGTGKLLGGPWWSGDAMWMSFANYEYQSFDMTWLAHYPAMLDFLTHLTVLWECSYIVFVWPRLTRPIVLALAVPLHLGIALCMGMITFGLVMLIANLAFVSPGLVRGVMDSSLQKLRLAPSTE